MGNQVVSGGVNRLVGHRVERVEDEQRRGGVIRELGAACLAPVPRHHIEDLDSRRCHECSGQKSGVLA